MRKTKIICTIGPASASPAILDGLIEAGMDAARLNFSHGSRETHKRAIQAIRDAAERHQAAVAIIQDLQGPRIRIGSLAQDHVDVAAGDRLRLVGTEYGTPPPAGPGTLPVTYADLAKDLKPGARIMVDDGLLELRVERIADAAVECTVVTGGQIHSHKGLNFPGSTINASTMTEKDHEDLLFGLGAGIDYVALSFVRGPQDVLAARKLIEAHGGDVPIIAKIERPEALENLDGVLEQAYGILIARGDLGVEVGPEAVPVLQKRMIAEANARRRLVITATQMLESMTKRLRPTRAEASDVANAIFDGTDAVMLSAETAVGEHPVAVVEVMDRIIRAAERGEEPGVMRRQPAWGGTVTVPEAVCAAATSAAASIGAEAIVGFSETGATAALLSKQRPAAKIIGFTPFETVRRRMALYWGVVPLTMPRVADTDARLREVERRLKAENLTATGHRLVIVSGALVGQRGGTNLLKLHDVV